VALRTVGVRLTADVSSYMANMRRAGGSTRDFVGEMDKAAKAGRLDSVADGVGAVGLGLVGMAGYAVNAALKFDKSMSAVKAATHGSAAEMDQLRKAALQAGQDTQYSATGAADAITELSKAGVATADILNGGLNGALSLAAAGQLEVGEAAEIAASAMTQFKLKGKDIPHVADLLAAAAGKAQGTVHDMGAALNQAGLIAAQTGLSIEETTGGLAAFASAGLMGSDAGTSFKQMLLMLQAPSEKSKNLMEELGISLYDSSGQFVGLTAFAGQLQTALKDLTPEARAAAMAQIFGADATRAASIMYEQGSSGVQQWIDKVNDAGYAQETAALLTDNLAGDIERLKGSIETMAIQAGSASNGGLRQLVQVLEGIVDGIASLPSFVTSSATILAGVGGAAALLAAGWVKSRRGMAEFRSELESTGPSGERAARGLEKVTSAATKAGLVFAGLQAAGAIVKQFQDDLKPQVEAMATGLEKYASGGKLAGEASRVLGDDLKDLKVGFDFLADSDNGRRKAVKNIQDGLEGLVPGLEGTNTSLTKTRERITSMDAALAQMAQSGNATAANQVFQKLAAELATGGVSMEEFRKQFPQYAAALEVAGKATGDAAAKTDGLGKSLEGAADKQEEFKTATDAAAAAADGQREALSQLADMMKAETNPVFGLINAQEKLAEAQTNASKATKEHGKNSKEAKAANRDLAVAAIDLQAAVGALGNSFNGKMTPALRDTLKAAGLTDAKIKNLEGQFKSAKKAADAYDGKYEAKSSAPGAKQAKVDLDKAYTAANGFAGPYAAKASAPGAKQAEAQLKAAWDKAKGFDGNWTANLKLQGYAEVKKRLLDVMSAQYKLSHPKASANDVAEDRREKARFMHTGGPVTGPGTATSDSIAAYLSNGEHVMTAAEVAALGGQGAVMAMRRAIRSGKRMQFSDETPGFARGGPVMPFPADVSHTKVLSMQEALALIVPQFSKDWPSSPSAQRGDSGVWRDVVKLIKSGPKMGSFGNAYRAGDPKWHGSGRAVDWMGYNMDALAQFLAAQGPLELIHRTNRRDYAYTRGRNKGSFNSSLMNAHRNHIHIAMQNGGTIREPVYGIGASGATYSLGENYQPERVMPNWQPAGGGGGGGGNTTVLNLNLPSTAGVNPVEYGRQVAEALKPFLAAGGSIVVRGQTVLAAS
jgi:TP901 family phage tail tape measure protein